MGKRQESDMKQPKLLLTYFPVQQLNKYSALLRYMIISTLQFRAEMAIWTILDLVPFLVLFLVWISMYQGQTILHGYSLNQTIHYYLLVILIGTVSDVHFEEWRSKEIREGKIDFFLIRPLSYLEELLWKDIGGKIVYIALFIPFLALFFGWLTTLGLGAMTIQPNQLVSFFILLILAYLINFMIGLWIVLGTFWLEGSHGLQHFKWVSITLLSGSMLPIAFMPDWIAALVNILPFKYLYAIPIGVIQGTYLLTKGDVIYLGLTLGSMYLASQWLWSKALYHYSSAGG